jgi:hypothetical protein
MMQPDHEFSHVESAAGYYLERIASLAEQAKRLRNYYFLDAQSIKRSTKATLQGLQQFLELKTPLSENYNIFEKTQQKLVGDISLNMSAGTILKQESNYQDIVIPESVASSMNEAYLASTQVLKCYSLNDRDSDQIKVRLN